MEQPLKRVTVKQIAERAGTSIGTVDRALNNRTGISQKTRSEILAVAEELGYRPNRFASVLRKNRTTRLGISYPRALPDFYNDVDAGVQAAEAELQDYGIVVEKIRYDTQDAQLAYQCLQQIKANEYDGLAINAAGGRTNELIDNFIDSGTPVITFNNDAPQTKRPFYVGSNTRESGMIGGELLGLLQQGRGSVSALGNFTGTTPFTERFGGFCEYIQLAFPSMQIYPSPGCSTPEAGEEIVTELIGRVPNLGGIFCTGYTPTLGAIAALKKLQRPDIALVGFDVTPKTAQAMEEGWSNALIFQDPYKQGYMAIKLLARYVLEQTLPTHNELCIENRIVLKSNLHSYTNPCAFT